MRVALIEGGPRAARLRSSRTPDPVPGWYQQLLEIPVQQRIDTAAAAERADPCASPPTPRNEIGEAWTQFRDGAAILGLFSLLVLGLSASGDGAHRRAAARSWAPGSRRVGGGNYAARVAAKGPREISALARRLQPHDRAAGGLEDANRRLTGQMLAIQEEERAELARDLHDEMGPFLFAMRVDAEAHRRRGAQGRAGRQSPQRAQRPG